MSLNGVNSNYQAYETNTVSGSDKKVSTKEISKIGRASCRERV